MVEDLLREYFKANGKFPQRIVFLRDGVSEGQFKTVSRLNSFFKIFMFLFILFRREDTR